MKTQTIRGDWDYLIVLDACRFDAFESVYRSYVEGDLEKRESSGSATPEWAAKTFQGDHDITYFSANPFINDLGIPLNELEWGASFDSDWTASDHIANVHDVWDEAWDEDAGTVLPGDLNEYVRDNWTEATEGDRTIVHYMQPHAPFIAHGTGRKVNTIQKSFQEAKGNVEMADGGTTPSSSFLDPVKTHAEDVLARSELAMKLGMLVELDPGSVLDLGSDGTKETLERYYMDNLRAVLAAACELVADLEGRIIITSDHGEAFGEQGVWEHHVETPIPELLEVPWLVVEDVHESPPAP